MPPTHRLALLVSLVLCTGSMAQAAVHDVTVDGKDFRLYVPDGAKVVRGVLCNFNGSGADHRAMAGHASVQAIMDSWSFGFIATRGFGNSDGPVLVRALAMLGDASGHPEIANAPLVATGYSLGGYASNNLVRQMPERVIGFVNMRGNVSGGTGNLSPAARLVPGVFLASSADGAATPFDVQRSFNGWRQQAPVAFGVEWVAGHTPSPQDDGNLWMFTWFYVSELIRLRYPADAAPKAGAGGTVTLKPLDENAGWLAAHPTWENTSAPKTTSPFPEIGPAATWPGNKLAASFMPSEAAARFFRGFLARDKLGTVVPRNVAMKFTSPATTMGLGAPTFPAGMAIPVTVDPRTLMGITKLEIFSGATKLAELTAPPWQISVADAPGGLHGLTAVATTAGGAQSSTYEVYAVRAPAAFGTDEGRAVGAPPPAMTTPDGGLQSEPDAGAQGGTGGSAPGGSGGSSGQAGGGGSDVTDDDDSDVTDEDDDEGATEDDDESSNDQTSKGGCAVGGRGRTPFALLLLVALVAPARSRRRR